MPGGEECVARLRVPAGTQLEAQALASALEPDNKRVPQWLRVECRAVETVVECLVHVEGCGDPRRILSLRNTVDDIILNIRAAIEAARASGE